MQLIWIDAATVVRRVTGVVLTLWVVAAGSRCERRGQSGGSRDQGETSRRGAAALLALAACLH